VPAVLVGLVAPDTEESTSCAPRLRGRGGSLRPTIPARPHPAQALRLGMLPGRELPGQLGMLPGLGSQRPTLLGDALVHARDVQLDLGNLWVPESRP
jgi:hypothetical protein